MIVQNNISPHWKSFIEVLLQQGKSVAIGTFDLSGKMLSANAAMCYFLDADMQTFEMKNSFVNPVFTKFLSPSDTEVVFDGLLTIGNLKDTSYVLSAKVYRADDSILVFAEADAPFLFEENKKMSALNREVNNLQRQLIKEKKSLQIALDELRETQQMLIQSEKMNALGKLVAGVAHELNNPVSFVYCNLFSLETYVADILAANQLTHALIDECGDEKLRAAADKIRTDYELDELQADIADMIKESKTGIERVKTIVEDLRKFSRLDEAEIKQIDLIENIQSTINIVRSEISRKKINFKQCGPEKLLLDCYPGQLNQAIMNVLINAIDAVDIQGEVQLAVTEEDEKTCIAITDNGGGIADEIKNRIFEPFFTTKPVGSGVGLGLSITYKIIHELHGGNIDISSIPGQSTTFKLIIPTKIS